MRSTYHNMTGSEGIYFHLDVMANHIQLLVTRAFPNTFRVDLTEH
jgi:hypothetical protein